LDVQLIGAAHCTGARAYDLFREILGPERCRPCPAGTVLEFEI
jgi:metal-dependent hydrolase (beta-lactamase superfamily II)